MNIQSFTTKEIEDELERRKNHPLPEQLKAVNIGPLREMVEEYIEFLATDYHDDHDYGAYITECAVEAFYGKHVWDWVNERMA